MTDPIGRKVKSVYDAAGKAVQVIKAFPTSRTTYSANGQVTKIVYDGFGLR